MRDVILSKLEAGDNTISWRWMENFRLLDLLDPWHIPHPFFENFTDTIRIENVWDVEHALVQCGRTALILYDREINKELRYFEKHNPWLKFFKSKSEAILVAESGWRFYMNGISVIPQIFRRLYVAGIVQLLEDWPQMVTPRRANITRKVHTLVKHQPRERVPEPISLTGNIQIIFYIYSTSIMLSVVEILIVEIKMYNYVWQVLLFIKWWSVAKWKYVAYYLQMWINDFIV